MKTQQELKSVVAQAALDSIRPLLTQSSVIGIGTGSTVNFFIEHLQQASLPFKGTVSSSISSTELLESAGLSVIETKCVEDVDVYVDGADEVDPNFALIKGGGGALTQEKIVASMATKFVCIVDDSKLVETLGSFPLPIEVIPSALSIVSKTLRIFGGVPTVRSSRTENGNLIIDVIGLTIENPDTLERTLNDVPGVVTVGLFALQRPHVVLVARQNGTIDVLTRDN